MLLMPGDDVVHPAEVSADPRTPNVEILRHGRPRAAGPRCGAFANSRLRTNLLPWGCAMTRIAVLDDWQEVAKSSAAWSPLMERAEVRFFREPLPANTRPRKPG